MKKPKKIDQKLLDLETNVKFCIKRMEDDKTMEVVENYQRAVAELSNYQQKLKNSKTTKSYVQVVDEYKIIK